MVKSTNLIADACGGSVFCPINKQLGPFISHANCVKLTQFALAGLAFGECNAEQGFSSQCLTGGNSKGVKPLELSSA